MRLVLPDGEELSHEYDTGGNLARVSGRFNGSDYNYLQKLEYDKFGQRRYMALGNNIKTLYRYEPTTRRLKKYGEDTGKLEFVKDGVEYQFAYRGPVDKPYSGHGADKYDIANFSLNRRNEAGGWDNIKNIHTQIERE